MTQANDLFQHLRANGLRLRAETASDGQLLDRFLADRDEAAFEALLARLGPMVWAVCRRVLADLADTEDAFQATFLVLVRKGRSVVPRDRVGNWLYGVAYHAARKARVDRARRRDKEHRAAAMTDSTAPDTRDATDLAAWVDRELSRLPEKYRAPVVLCDLEGKTRAEAARHLGCPEGTVAGRLARARAMLSKRLAKHGVVVSPVALTAALTDRGAAGALPAALLEGTRASAVRLAAGHLAGASPGAQALMEGVMKAMLVKKLRGVALGLALLVAAGLGVVPLAGRPAAGQVPAPMPNVLDEPYPGYREKHPRPEDDLARLVGTWKITAGTVTDPGGNRDLTPAELRGAEVTVDKDATLTFAKAGLAGQTCFVVTLDPGQSPRQMNLYPVGKDEDKCLRAVYRLDKDGRLELACYDRFEERRPPAAVGAVSPKSGRYLVLERADKPLPPTDATGPERPAGKMERPKLPADRARVITEQFAGTWQVAGAERDGKPLGAWERRGFLFSVSPDGTFTAHRGPIAGGHEFACDLDLSATPRQLILTPPSGKPVRVGYEFQGAALVLDWTEGADRHRFTLVSQGGVNRGRQPAGLGLTVEGDPRNPVAARLEGRWRLDLEPTRRLSGRDPKDVRGTKVALTFATDPAVAGEVPGTYRELLAGKRIYLAGRVTMQMGEGRGVRTQTRPFLLTEHAGTAVLIYFDGPDGAPWSREEVAAIQLVPARDGAEDLLFLTPFDPSPDEHAAAFQRVVGRR
ncbi:MAG TPA: sigma-70 family RNA polymerase sigma factor [Gemmataceae bacterium]|nr:sigma-70 family RNA polymerase sigma factor [Gemmataceae bacterium]